MWTKALVTLLQLRNALSNCVTTETPQALIVLRRGAGYAMQFPAIENAAASVYVVIVVKPEK